MKMIQAIIRPEKEREVVDALEKTGFHAFTRLDVFGRGRQKGLIAGPVRYEELAKVYLMVVVEDQELERALSAVKISARTGNPGDGKIFITPIEEAYTIRTRHAP